MKRIHRMDGSIRTHRIPRQIPGSVWGRMGPYGGGVVCCLVFIHAHTILYEPLLLPGRGWVRMVKQNTNGTETAHRQIARLCEFSTMEGRLWKPI